MKKSNWLALLLIALSVAALMGYHFWDRVRTDLVPPQITVAEDTLEVSVYQDNTALLEGVTARDNRDGDVSGTLIVEHVGLVNSEGDATVRYAAFDRSGNVAKISRNIRFTDYESPRFGLSAPLLYAAGSTFEVVDQVKARDVLEGDISHRVRAASLADKALSDAGVYEVQFRVTNSLGDTREIVLQTELYPVGAYNADLTLDEYLIYLSVGDRFDAGSYLKEFRHSAKRVGLSGGIPEGYELDVTGSVDTRTPGVYEVKYTMEYIQGNQTYTGASRLVVIVEE